VPKYKYRAVDARGRRVKGTTMAADEKELHENLKREEKYLISAARKASKIWTAPLKPQSLADFCRELGALLGAGVSLVRALGIVSKNESIKPKESAMYAKLLRLMRQGVALSDAMESMGRVFPPMMITMFRSAEAAGNLDLTVSRLAHYYTKQHRLNAKVKSSILYPKFLGCLIVVVVAVLIGYVLPQFESLFSLMDELPLPTRILYSITRFAGEYWYLIILGTVMAAIAIRVLCSIGAVRIKLDKMRVHMPLIGKLWRVIYTARFARTLSALYSAGIPIVTAMQIAKDSIGNSWIEKQFDAAVSIVHSGGNLSDAVEAIDGFSKKLVFSVCVGAETGSLEVMLNTIADDLEYDSEMAVGRMVSYLEPAMIISMAFIVGFIMIAVMMPIYGSYSAIEASAYK